MSNVLLILDDAFVGLADAEPVVISKKQELSTKHAGSQIDQFLLSNIVLGKVDLTPNNYDSIYFLDSSRDFNQTIPNHANIKQSLRLATSLSLRKSNSSSAPSKVGSKLSGLKKFKKLNRPAAPATPATQAAAKTSTVSTPPMVEIDSPAPALSPSPLIDTEKKLRYLDDLSSSSSEDEDDDELIDENELITETSLLNTSSIICLNEPASNGVKRRKACKDCTCGLAEKEAFSNGAEEEATQVNTRNQGPRVQFSAEELTEVDFTIEGKTGGCGSCSLGDAFRCAGCPFLGLPAFKPGQAITLDSISDDL